MPLRVVTEVRSRRGVRWELLTGLLISLLWVGVLLYTGRNTWFRRDQWDFLLRAESGSLEGWVQPHGGHLQVVAVGLHKFLYGVAGMDFWPLYYLPHVVAYGGMSFYMWRVLLRRGSDRLVAFATFAMVMTLGLAGFVASHSVGIPLGMMLFLCAAHRIDVQQAPALRDGLALASLFLLMMMTDSLGVAYTMACLLVVLASRPLRHRWWWSFLPALVVYISWYMSYGRTAARGRVYWDYLPNVPAAVVRMVGEAAKGITGLDGPTVVWGCVVAVLAALGLGWLVWRRALGTWDWLILSALTIFVLMVGLIRGGGGVSLEQDRYPFILTLLAVPLVVPHLRLGRNWPLVVRVGVVALVGGSLVGYNAAARLSKTDQIEAGTLAGRSAIEAVAALVGAGEPAIDDVSLKFDLRIPNAGRLLVSDVRLLLADGWEPLPGGAAAMEALRPGLRVQFAAKVPAGAVGFPLEVTGPIEDGCVPLAAGGSLQARVVRSGWFTLESARPAAPLRGGVTWEDRFGETAVTVPTRRRAVQVAEPVGETLLTIDNTSPGTFTVCGIEASPVG